MLFHFFQIKRTFTFTLLLLFFPTASFCQEVTIGITKKGLNKINVAVETNLPKELEDILISDLTLCDYFAIQNSRSDADILINFTKTGNLTIEGKLFELKKNQMIFGKRVSGESGKARHLIHSLIDSIVNRLTGETGIAQTKLAFENNQQIFISDYDGANPVQLTKDKALSLFPEWSPDGNRIAYTSYLSGYPQIFIYNIREGKRNKLCAYPGLNTSAVFSPNGKKIAVTLSKDGNPEIYTINTDGTDLKRITNDRSVDTSPCWSPDGRRIAFVSNRSGTPQIYITNANGGASDRLTFEGSYNTNPCWSSKGNVIVYNSLIGGLFQICTIDVDTGNVSQITSGNNNSENPSFAPDGRHVVFSRTNVYNKDLYIIDIFFKESHKVKSNAGKYSNPAWGK